MNNLPTCLQPPAGGDRWEAAMTLALAYCDLAIEQLDVAAQMAADMPTMPRHVDWDDNVRMDIAIAARTTRFFRGMLAVMAAATVPPALIDQLRKLAPRPRPRPAHAAASVPALVRERAWRMYPAQLACLWLDNATACLTYYADETSDVTAAVAADTLASVSATLSAEILQSEHDGGDTIDEVTEAWTEDDDAEPDDDDGADIGEVDSSTAAVAAPSADDEPAPLVAPAAESCANPIRFREWL